MSDIGNPPPRWPGDVKFGLMQDFLTGLVPQVMEILAGFAAKNPDWNYWVDGPEQFKRMSIQCGVQLKAEACRARNPRIVTLSSFRLDPADYDFLGAELAALTAIEGVKLASKAQNGGVFYELRVKDQGIYERRARKIFTEAKVSPPAKEQGGDLDQTLTHDKV
jgi:hypothetical protein